MPLFKKEELDAGRNMCCGKKQCLTC